MFKKVLYNILGDLNNFKSREAVYAECVSDRLNRDVNLYNKDLELACNYLMSRSSLKVLRNISKRDDM